MITEYFVASIAGAAGVFELVRLIRGERLISPVVYSWAKEYPIFPFSLGVLIGHFLWPQ